MYNEVLLQHQEELENRMLNEEYDMQMLLHAHNNLNISDRSEIHDPEMSPIQMEVDPPFDVEFEPPGDEEMPWHTARDVFDIHGGLLPRDP